MGYRLDRIKTVYGYYANNYVLGSYPMQVGIELTNNCNLKCVMCPHSRMTRQKGFMSEALFRRVIDEIKGRSEFVYLYGMGESVLHPKFFELVDYAVRSGLKTSLSTNLTLLNEKINSRLIESGIDFFVLTLDGITKDTYETIRIGGQFERNLAQVKRFLQLKYESKARCYVDIQFILMNDNRDEATHVRDLFTREERSAINAYRVKPVYASPSITSEKITHQHPCYFLWNTITITWDGRVALCCMDYDAEVVLGDIQKSSVYEVWNNGKIAALRKMHKDLAYERLSICNKCSFPEKNYFSHGTILASALLSADTMRKMLPLYERLFIIKQRT